MDDEEEHVVGTLILYIIAGSGSQQAPTSHQGLLRMIGGESGATFIHRVLYGNCPNFCHQLLCLG